MRGVKNKNFLFLKKTILLFLLKLLQTWIFFYKSIFTNKFIQYFLFYNFFFFFNKINLNYVILFFQKIQNPRLKHLKNNFNCEYVLDFPEYYLLSFSSLNEKDIFFSYFNTYFDSEYESESEEDLNDEENSDQIGFEFKLNELLLVKNKQFKFKKLFYLYNFFMKKELFFHKKELLPIKVQSFFFKVQSFFFKVQSFFFKVQSFFFKVQLCFKKKELFFSNFFFQKRFIFFLKKGFIFFGKKRFVFFSSKEKENDKLISLKKFSFSKKKKNNYFNYFFDSEHLKEFFLNFLNFFFFKKSYIFFFNKKINSSNLINYVFFIPDICFFFKNFKIQLELNRQLRYNNISPITGLNRSIFPKTKLLKYSQSNNILLYYLSTLSEFFFKKPFLFKLFFINKILKKLKFKFFLLKIYKKLKRSTFRFKHNFFLSEILKILIFSFFFKDSTLFLNWVTWTIMHIPYKDVKSFLYFLKVLIKKYILNKNDYFDVKGFIFDIRGKVGVTGDAKKRHTLISWGQSSFSKKKLKLTLKQGLVYTRTGVMGVTVIIFF